ncbi:transcription antiterminator [Mammaliicoccus lentus]|nr:transcription antiterminator [Mammaliicoccus lentus]
MNLKITKRQLQLVDILVKQKGYLTIRDYAEKLNISQRTVHNDLQKINEYMLNQGFEVLKKPGRGVKVNHFEIFHKENDYKNSHIYSTDGRRLEIIKLLLFDNRTVTFEYLSETFMVSKSSISYDLKFINYLLTKGNNTKLVSDFNGTRIVGSELDIQKSFQEFNSYLFKMNDNIFENDENDKFSILFKYYGENIVKVCSRILYSYMRINSGIIAEHYVSNILSVLITLVYRIKNDFHISEMQLNNDDHYETIAESILKKVSLRINFKYKREDIKFLSKYLKSYHFEALPTENTFNEVTYKMIKKVSESLNIRLSDDEVLEGHLKSHIPPMIYRLQNNIHIKNPFLKQIKNEFSVVFNLIWLLLNEYEEEWNVKFNEDEIGFLTIHFQSAIEQIKENKKILVVCPTGIATSELLVNRLVNVLPKVSSIEVASIKELNLYNFDELDLIVSTTSLKIDSNKVIVVSPLLSEYDIQNITQFFSESFNKSATKNQDDLNLKELKKVISKNTIFIEQNFTSHEELLEVIGNKLFNEDIIQKPFMETVLQRENLGGTDLNQGVAIPHGNPKYVNKTNVSVIINKSNFKWKNEQVQIIFLICISEKDNKKIKGILSDLYSVIQNKQILELIKKASNKLEVYKILGG